ncbi:MAG: beta galactosidase jelly roll domain-containing protein, partial [Muribaculaceae bacterium]|nr:beta galactosidase jelly roll domain-containing protein [Muribaculaceae bacterium]
MRRLAILTLAAVALTAVAQRSETLLRRGWRFTQTDDSAAVSPVFDDSRWKAVEVPHDWAITGPFDRSHDLQTVAVTQDGEKRATLKTGRSGGLPYMGTGWYRTTYKVPQGTCATLVFDGAMSEAQVWVNGRKAGEWPYGYASFHLDVTPLLRHDGQPNTLAVRLENKPFSSRWYPGAGLYRNVRLVTTDSVHVPVWGTHVTTPQVEDAFASVRLLTEVENPGGRELTLRTVVRDPQGRA